MEYKLRTKLRVHKKDPKIKDFKNLCRFNNPQYTFLKAKGKWTSGVPKFLTFFRRDEDYYYFPRGLIKHLDKNSKIKYNVVDNKMSKEILPNNSTFKLEEVQNEAITEFISKLKKEKSLSGVFEGQCGTGKTIMGVEISRRLNQKTLILVDQESLAKQWFKAIKMVLGLEDDEIYCSVLTKEKVTENTKIDIFTIQSLNSNNTPFTKEQRDKYGLVMVDECHIVPATETSAVVSFLRPMYNIGLSATPYRQDRLDDVIKLILGDVLTVIKKDAPIPVVRLTKIKQIIPTEKDVFDLVRQGTDFNTTIKYVDTLLKAHPEYDYLMYTFSKAFRGFFASNTNSSNGTRKYINQVFMKLSIVGRKIKRGPRAGETIPGIVDTLYLSEYRNKKIVDNVEADYYNGRHIIILSMRKAHMNLIKEKLATRGIPSVLITGNVSKKKRDKIYEAARASETRVFIATFSLAQKGLDIPILDSLHLTHPFAIRSVDKGGSLEQATGRVRRPKIIELDPIAIVNDYIDTGGAPGFHGMNHVKYYQRQGWEIKWK